MDSQNKNIDDNFTENHETEQREQKASKTVTIPKSTLIVGAIAAVFVIFAVVLLMIIIMGNGNGGNIDNSSHNHKFGEWETRIAATCGEDGEEIRSCKCGEIEVRTIPKTNKHKEANVGRIEPTCTENGAEASVVCSECGTVLSVSKEIIATGHVEGEWIVTSYPTKKSDGFKYQECSSCGEKLAEEVIKYDHSNILTYSVNPDGKTCTIVGIEENVTSLTIPSSINGYIVTEIASNSLQNSDKLERLVISEGIKTIYPSVIINCSSLKYISIPNGLISFDSPFERCDSIVYNEYDNALYLGNEENPYLWLVKSKNTEITTVEIHPNTEYIDSYAFSDCEKLTNVVMSDKIASVGMLAFENCKSLNYNEYDNAFYLGSDSNPYRLLISAKSTEISSCEIHPSCEIICSLAFYECSSLTSLTVTDRVSRIDFGAFGSCSSLVNIELPESLRSIGIMAFGECTLLEEIKIPSNVSEIGFALFGYDVRDYYVSIKNISVSESNPYFKSIDGNLYTKDGTILLQYAIGKQDESLTIPYGAKAIGKYAFVGSNYIKNITIPEGVVIIGENAFYDCQSLTNIDLPNTLKYIGCSAFEYSGIESIVIPNSVIEVGMRAFADSAIDKAVLSENMERIEKSVFSGCGHLEEVVIPYGIIYIGEYAFCGCSTLTSVVLPDSVLEIDRASFAECYKLRSVTLSRGLTKIGDDAFSLSGLTKIVIPDSVITIGSAFSMCWALEEVVFSNSVKMIENGAFYMCHSLNGVYFDGTKSDWNSIIIEDGNEDLLEATLYFC